MDARKLNQLDPKLKEAYDRVMSGQVPVAAKTPTGGEKVHVGGIPSLTPLTPTQAAEHTEQNTAKEAKKDVKPKKQMSLKPILIGLGIVIFLLAYTVVWIFVLKVPVPFLTK